MKILSCITKLDELIYLKKAGADEVYFAYSKIPNYANAGVFCNLNDIKELIDMSHKLRIKVYLAANNINMSKKMMRFETIIRNISKVISFGVDGIIISDIGLFNAIKSEFDIPVHLSSLNPVFNFNSLKFFYDNFKISRVILSNQLSAIEAKNIIDFSKKNGIETEIFFYKFFGCPYINGFCMMHTDAFLTRLVKSEGGLCRAGVGKRPAKILQFNKKENYITSSDEIEKRVSYRISFGGAPRILNAASFFDYYVSGVDFLKYGTRTDPTEKRIHSVQIMKKTINLVDKLLNMYDTEKARQMFLNIKQ